MGFKQNKKKNRVIKTAPESSKRKKIKKTDSEFKTPKRGKLSNILTTVAIVVLLGVFVFSAFQIFTIQKEYTEGANEYKGIVQDAIIIDDETGYRIVNYQKLKELNPDFVGWIDIPGTNISYPIVYSSANNDVYLRTTFTKQYNSAGSIFIDYRCNPSLMERNTLIYGHRMKNGTMFNQVEKFLNQEFWQDNSEIHIYTDSGIMVYNIFSAYKARVEDECYTFGFENDNVYLNWLTSVKGKSKITTGITPGVNDKVIILSTCVNGNTEEVENFRNVVIAVYTTIIPNPAT